MDPWEQKLVSDLRQRIKELEAENQKLKAEKESQQKQQHLRQGHESFGS